MATPSLATPRLLLRSLTLEHLPSLVCWEADAELRHLNDEDPDPAPAHEVEAIVRGWLAPGRVDLLPFAIHLRSDDRCVGWCMLAAIDPAAGECRIGFTLGERELWGSGLGREVLSALLDHAFQNLGLWRVLGEVHAFNLRSRRLLERAGFQLIHTEPGAIRRGNHLHDELVFSLQRPA
ncbi:MAG: GNAT family N-acetyltransferase [Deltaproteobacteria bacterium]|nr:GNAT family N-acetyltransferase [Deltaproteobacteria bacterium]